MENYCCWDDLLPLLKNPRGDCCSTLEEIREVVRRHREEPIRSIGGGNGLSKQAVESRIRKGQSRRRAPLREKAYGMTSGMRDYIAETSEDVADTVGSTARYIGSLADGPRRLAVEVYERARSDTKEEEVSLAEYESALAFEPSRKDMETEINRLKTLMLDGEFAEVTLLANEILGAIETEENAAERLLIFKSRFLPLMYAMVDLPNKALKKVANYNLQVWGVAPATQLTQVILSPFGTKVPPWFPIPKDWETVYKIGREGAGLTGVIIAYGLGKYMAKKAFKTPLAEYKSVSRLIPKWWESLKRQGLVTEATAPENHAVYLGFGLVIEMGASQWCKHARRRARNKGCLTLSSLQEFVARGGDRGGVSEIFRVKYKDRPDLDNENTKTLRKQLRRALDLGLNPVRDYDFLENHCQHWSSQVITGDKTLGTQSCNWRDRLIREYIPVVVPSPGGCGDEPCLVRAVTDDGDACGSRVKTRVLPPFREYCDLPALSPKTGQDWGYVSSNKKTYGCINPPAGTKGAQFYPCV